MGGKLYLAGGLDDSGGFPTTNVEVYDPATNAWTPASPMPTGRSDATGTVIDGLLYVLGGSRGEQPAATVDVYDPRTRTWQAKPAMPTPRFGQVSGDGERKALCHRGHRSRGQPLREQRGLHARRRVGEQEHHARRPGSPSPPPW